MPWGGAVDLTQLSALLDLAAAALEQRELVPDEVLDALRRLSPAVSPLLAHLLTQIDRFDHDGGLTTIAQLRATFEAA